MLSENSSRPTLLKGGPREKWVTGSARRARQEQAARHSEAQRSITLHQVRTRFDDQTSLQSSWGVPVMMMTMIMSMKPLLVTQSIGLSCAGMPVNLHVQALVLKALLIM